MTKIRRNVYNLRMVLSIGEILADIVLRRDGRMRIRVGGAPFNAAVACARAGAETAFVGRVGNDPPGRHIAERAKEFPVRTLIEIDDARPTTLAFVSIDENGERDFKFFRENAADYNIEFGESDILALRPTVVHLGSLMLNREEGREVAARAIRAARAAGAILSFDVNYRADIFPDPRDAVEAMAGPIEACGMLKLSRDELDLLYGGKIESVASEIDGKIICVTDGARGCEVRFEGKAIRVPAKPVDTVDATGAGDAFFGTFLGIADARRNEFDADAIAEAAAKANEKGAETAMVEGAIRT